MFNVIEPMKIGKPKNDADLRRAMENGSYFGQLKKDGAFYQIVKNDVGEVGVFSRTVSKKTGTFVEKSENVPHITDWAKEILPPNTNIMTEIYYPGKTSKDAITIMGCLPDKAVKRQEQEYGFIHCFIQDCVKWEGKELLDMPAIERVGYLERLRDNLSWLEVADIYEENLPALLSEAFASGEEGMVFKKKNAGYFPGKRPVGITMKAKTEDTIDCVITGFTEPQKVYTGKNLGSWNLWEGDVPITKGYAQGWIGGYKLGAYDEYGNVETFGTVVSGLTDSLLEDGAKHPEKYLGSVVEIQCMSVDKNEHTLRHARLKQFRPDKPASDCRTSEIFS